MADEITIKHETNEAEHTAAVPAGEAIGALVDNAKDIGGALERLNALEAAHETVKAGLDDTKAVVDGTASRIEDLNSKVYELGTKIEGLAVQGVSTVDKPAEEVISVPEAAVEDASKKADEAVEKVPVIENVAPSKRGGIGGFLDWLNIH